MERNPRQTFAARQQAAERAERDAIRLAQLPPGLVPLSCDWNAALAKLAPTEGGAA